jgi:hypothetical protein
MFKRPHEMLVGQRVKVIGRWYTIVAFKRDQAETRVTTQEIDGPLYLNNRSTYEVRTGQYASST